VQDAATEMFGASLSRGDVSVHTLADAVVPAAGRQLQWQ